MTKEHHMALTPMLQQYKDLKKQYSDCLLFDRVGDFYEMYFEDAVIGARDMDVVLTKKSCGEEEKAPMCGVPYHAVETYIARLLDRGHKVAIAEQMEDPALAKGLVKRQVIRIITPGTVIDPNMLSEKDNNFLASVFLNGRDFGLSWVDISTGEFFAMQQEDDRTHEKLSAQLARIEPHEIITNLNEEEAPWLWEQASFFDKLYISVPSGGLFEASHCHESLRAHYGSVSLKSKGLAEEDVPLMFRAVGAVLGYIRDTQMQELTHLNELRIINTGSSMSLDKATIRNLEITETLFEHKLNGSLLGVLDRCGTAMGSRRMKQWLREPLNDLPKIRARLDAVEVLTEDVIARNNLREALKSIYDLERLCGRISLGTANARDLLALKTSLQRIPDIKAELSDLGGDLLEDINSRISPLTELCEEIEDALTEDAPYSVREGGLIKEGYSEELDELNSSSAAARQWIASLEPKEREHTGIKNLRVGYNKVFGYYIEVSRSNADQVPDNYIRKQTLVNGERYITSEMKEMESTVLSAQTRINDLEYRLFTALRLKAAELSGVIQETSFAIAEADVLASFAESSVKLGYVKPNVDGGDEIVITKGRHPVIENTIKDGVYVSNDLYINRSDASMLLITGPNMSGKSTYMRQLALIVLMAQAGCFVPADSARIGICDKIFTRIGASDNIAMGQSTFFVEMSELAYILNTATSRSLVILDEIGRGTSTYDGLSIAWAVVDYLTGERKIRTLFATHYHELTGLSEVISGVKNLNVDVSEQDGTIVFLHRIVEGSASRSYGIHVARLAGVPQTVLDDAEERLESLEKSGVSLNDETPARQASAPKKKKKESQEQLSIFSAGDSILAEKIRNLDLMNITPSGAIAILEELQQAARKRQ
ncbi:MAG: DNA mismatch repair protein MutS [Firmicutes bacterium]|nr:DNA mismatch repair protein MutS [Bacillota bacterium]